MQFDASVLRTGETAEAQPNRTIYQQINKEVERDTGPKSCPHCHSSGLRFVLLYSPNSTRNASSAAIASCGGPSLAIVSRTERLAAAYLRSSSYTF